GVGSWFGHCNAWAAVSIMEPEPRESIELNEIPFTPADVKAYLTEVYMEIQSDFYGSRNGYAGTEEARGEIDYRDVYPAAFHVLVADLVGNRDRGIVIDRHTGEEVWNQPLRAFRSKAEPLYEVVDGEAKPMKLDVVYTRYNYKGEPQPEERGEQEVYPLLVTTTIHWMTDGLPAETLTDENINDDIDDETFADSWRIRDMWDDQVEIRTLTYELWLDRPVDDPKARIVGDGQWEHGSATGYSQLHPDFIWVPLANVNNYRDYENEFFDAKVITEEILPGTLAPHDDPEVGPQSVTVEGPVDIPDKPSFWDGLGETHVATLELEVTSSIEIHVLTVDVDITHTYIGDLEIVLEGPDGRRVTLKESGEGGGADDLHQTYDVKDFDGGNAAGIWILSVSDHAQLDTGTLDGFSLHVK
ncbi:MAG: proprotein convertase P-domain-containing protein, partial [Myxococcota bacterium]|nr:proprotein convertase P-domain-containing protein [Myxococcota bacterium]